MSDFSSFKHQLALDMKLDGESGDDKVQFVLLTSQAGAAFTC